MVCGVTWHTNTENIARALDRLVQAVEHLRTLLRSKELEQEFLDANAVYELLRTMKEQKNGE